MDETLDATKASTEVAEDLATDEAQQRRLAAYAHQRFGIDTETSRDIVQETIVEILRYRSTIHHAAGFAFRVFHLRCCAYVRQDIRMRTLRAEPQRDREEPAVEAHILLREGFEKLSLSCQKLLRAYYLEGKSLKETASELSVASSGVWKLINRCLGRLKRCLQS